MRTILILSISLILAACGSKAPQNQTPTHVEPGNPAATPGSQGGLQGSQGLPGSINRPTTQKFQYDKAIRIKACALLKGGNGVPDNWGEAYRQSIKKELREALDKAIRTNFEKLVGQNIQVSPVNRLNNVKKWLADNKSVLDAL